MSKVLVQKALGLLQDDDKSDKSQRNSKPSAKRCKKTEHNLNSNLTGPGMSIGCDSWAQLCASHQVVPVPLKTSTGFGKWKRFTVDRTADNLKILKQLRKLKPKSSVAQKVMEYYKQSAIEEPAEKPEVQRSILFDDDEDDKKKRKKRRNKDDSS